MNIACIKRIKPTPPCDIKIIFLVMLDFWESSFQSLQTLELMFGFLSVLEQYEKVASNFPLSYLPPFLSLDDWNMDLNQTIWKTVIQSQILTGLGAVVRLHVQFSPNSLDGAHAASKGAPHRRGPFGTLLWCSAFCPVLPPSPCASITLLMCSWLSSEICLNYAC